MPFPAAALTGPGSPLWSRAMNENGLKSENSAADGERLEEALKKPPAPSKGVKERKEARLAAALRENLRRRKAASRKDTD